MQVACKLRLIPNRRALDMSHEEIHALLKLAIQAGDDCGAVNAVFDQHIAYVDTRIRELAHLKQQLNAQRQRCGSGDNAVDISRAGRGRHTGRGPGFCARGIHPVG